MKKFAVIMAGGRGERLWPLSTPEKPKPFLKLRGEKSLLQETVSRISPFIPLQDIYVVTHRELVPLVALQVPELPKENIIDEPLGRNTAPCIGLAAILLETKDPQGVMVVLPADHVIKNLERFYKILHKAVEVAATSGYLVTLGIIPDQPATGYGYIRCGERFATDDDIEVYSVQSFTEKPDKETAKRFLAEGNYFWNSGMFIWRVDVILAEIKKHMPELYQGLTEIKAHFGMPDFDEVLTEVYKKQKSISIDYGVMEHSSRVLVIPANIGWSDVGDWSALEAILEKDEDGNILRARHLGIDTKDSIIFSESGHKLIATIGLHDVVIIDTEEALLVMDKRRAQEVREIVNWFQATAREGK